MKTDIKVNAVVVTYNRKNMLIECLDAILNQTFPVSRITLIDNASTDGTKKLLEEKGYLNNKKLNYIKLKKNTGGAGGFYEGLKQTQEYDYDFAWIMDDDVIPLSDSLEKLLKAKKSLNKVNEKVSFLASTVYGESGEAMNVPEIDTSLTENGYSEWYKYLYRGLIPIKSATFVSLLIDYKAIRKVGLPCKDYFIWGDDTEYTKRLSKFYAKGIFVGESKVIHKRKNAKSLNIENFDEPQRIKMVWRLFRNNKINMRFYEGNKVFIKALVKDIPTIFSLIPKKYGFLKSKQIIKGNFLAISSYSRFKKYILNQLKDGQKRV